MRGEVGCLSMPSNILPPGGKGVWHVVVTGTALGRVSQELGPCHLLGLSQV